jgi:crotonobetainyl-CoA:carnitine CoA-transferase CaiB-like acyl-CoA transferase
MSEPIETPPGRRHALPLSGVRVVDLTDGVAATSTRLLADLGADVILVEPPEGVASRRAHPQHEGIGLRFLTAHANKRGITLDLETRRGRRELLALTDGADIVAESLCPGRLADLGLGQQVMRQRNHRLVVMSVSEFGQSGPYRDWRGGEAVQMAMASTLTRSGAPDREPLLPPGDFATESGSLQAAFAALLAYYRAVDTGSGDYVDCAFHDMAVQALDPGFGMAGTATMGRPLSELPPGRPDARMLYPIFACADGHVRLCMLAAKHWRGMFKWLGEPTEFADPSFEQLITRFMAWDKLKAAIAALFAGQSRDELLCRGGELGIPIASLNTPFETATSDHVAARGSFVETEDWSAASRTATSNSTAIVPDSVSVHQLSESTTTTSCIWTRWPINYPAPPLPQSRPLAHCPVFEFWTWVSSWSARSRDVCWPTRVPKSSRSRTGRSWTAPGKPTDPTESATPSRWATGAS